MTFGYQTFVRVLRFWMVSIRLHKSWSHLEPRFVHGHDFKVNMTVTCQHDECPSACEERHCISLLLSTGSALGKLLLLHLWCRWVRSSVNFCERINIRIFLYINPRALFLFVFERISILTEISVHLCTTHPAYLWKGVGWFAKPWSQVHSKILHQRTWWRVGSSYWCTLAWASSAQARYIEHVIERGTYI